MTIKQRIQNELDEQVKTLNEDCESYREELTSDDDETSTIAELVEGADFDTPDFNIGFEQGYKRGLEIAMNICKDVAEIETDESEDNGKHDALKIVIYKSDTEEGYMYDLYASESDEDIESFDGGLCTTNIINALGMAYSQAVTYLKK